MKRYYEIFLILGIVVLLNPKLLGQFEDQFNSRMIYDSTGINGWNYFTGDGNAKMSFNPIGNGIARIFVDATGDTMNIWWALIKRCISNNLDLAQFYSAKIEFRIEARIKISDAPKRINLSLNTQRTTDFHTNLMEFDIPDTNNWHIISMTTKDFDAKPGDKVFAQLALMDWGLKNYKIDIDYLNVDVVSTDSVPIDEGVQVPYRPLVKSPDDFTVHLPVLQDATIDFRYSNLNFNKWSSENKDVRAILLSVNGTQFVIVKWDFSEFKEKKVDGSGLFEFTTYSLERSPAYEKDFGMIRVSEILGGEKKWDQENVTYDNFCTGQELDNVINSQMIIDVEVNKDIGAKNFITISNPVLQRMIDGKTLGLAVRPLGAIHLSFYAIENNNEQIAAKLHFNIKDELSNTGSNK